MWSSRLPRQPGQIGGHITALVEGPPVYRTGEVTAYSDFDPIRLMGIERSFVEFLREEKIPFEEN